MGKKQLIVNLISNVIAFVTSLIISFVLTPYLILSIGKEAYAFYPISNNFVSYMAIVSIALNSMASRFITIEIVKEKWNKAQSYFSSAFFANIILSFIFIIPMSLVVIYVNSFMSVPKQIINDVKILFILIFASMLVNILTTIFGISTFVTNRLDLKAGCDIFQGILKASLFIILFTLFKPSIILLGFVSFVISITNFIIQFVYTKTLLPKFRISYKLFDFQTIKELLSSGIWNSINSLGSVLLLSISLLLSNMFIGASAAGDLAIVQTLPNFMTTIISAIYAVFLPRITHVYAQRDKVALINEVKFSQKILGIISTVPAVLVIIFGKDFFGLWVPNQNSEYLQTLSIISIIPLIVHGNMWTIYGLTVTANKLRIPSLALIGAGAINVFATYLILNYTNLGLIAIPFVSAVISVLYYLFFIPMYISKQIKINIFTFYRHIIKAIFSAIAIIFLGNLLKQNIIILTWFDFFLWGGIFGIIGIIINAIFILDREDFKKVTSLSRK